MRDASNLKNALAKSFAKYLFDSDFSPREIYETELALYALEKLMPESAPNSFWALMSGYDFLNDISSLQKQTLFNARQILGRFRSIYAWKRALERYRKIAEEFPFLCGYDLREESFSRRKINSVSERWEIYESVLTQKLNYHQRRFEWAEAGEYRLEDHKRDKLYAVKIPKGFAFDVLPEHELPREMKRKKIEVSWQELIKTAHSMDEAETAERKSWKSRLEKVQIEIFGKTGKLRKADKLTFDGLAHLVGMVSSGKSTLMNVLAVWAARKGLHVTLILGDVVGILDTAQDLSKFEGVNPAPILGSGRESHLKRLHRVAADRQKESYLTPQHEGFKWLSTACPLDALRQDLPQYAFDLNFRPCLNLKKTEEKNREKKSKACPLFPVCPYHQAQRDLTQANVWIATPASLVFTRPAAQINAESIRFAELIAQKSDLVIIDEADRVQVQLDEIFSPHQILCGAGDSDGWLDELERQVGERTATNGRRFVTQDGLEDWRQAFHQAQLMADLAYNKLRVGRDLRKWLEDEDSFSELTLTDVLAKELSGDKTGKSKNYEEIRKKFDYFIDNEIVELFGRRETLSSGKSSGLREFATRLLMSGDSQNWFHELKIWISAHKLPPASKNKKFDETEILARKLELTIIIAVLTNRLTNLLENWRAAAEQLRIEDLTSRLSFGSPRDYQTLIPSAPMGNVLAFQFQERENLAPTLSFYRFTGIGRWLLLNLHRLLEAEGVEKANVLLLSGTSWAGETASYHVQAEVAGILAAPQNEIDAISESEFAFLPLDDEKGEPISVSGLRGEQRSEALRKMLNRLAKPDEFNNPSHFEETLKSIEEENRRRLLLVVGSYLEARIVFDQLQNIRSDWKNKIVKLEPDHAEWIDEDENSLRRGDLPNFPEKDKFILIAPLQAIERGHNILAEVEDETGKRKVAAIGAAYFLVRPHPQPKDLGYAVRALNSWTIKNAKDLPAQIAAGKSLAEVSRDWRARAQKRWRILLREDLVYSLLENQQRDFLTWHLLVSIWQVIGRLVRGGQRAHVFFCDAKFNPPKAKTDQDVSLLKEMKKVLADYIGGENEREAQIVRRLYAPLYSALSKTKNL